MHPTTAHDQVAGVGQMSVQLTTPTSVSNGSDPFAGDGQYALKLLHMEHTRTQSQCTSSLARGEGYVSDLRVHVE